jgi:hypothetical protein
MTDFARRQNLTTYERNENKTQQVSGVLTKLDCHVNVDDARFDQCLHGKWKILHGRVNGKDGRQNPAKDRRQSVFDKHVKGRE